LTADHQVYHILTEAKRNGKKLLAILLDPDKITVSDLEYLKKKLAEAPIHLVFIGGSSGEMEITSHLVNDLKAALDYPVVLFPGHPSHLVGHFDAVLLNVLISGNNPDYLINHHVTAVPFFQANPIEIIPNGYLLIEGGTETAVQKVTHTQPLAIRNRQKIIDTAQAAQLLGYKTVYLEAGSGAKNHVPLEIISAISKQLSIPLIVGGGIKSKEQINQVFQAGADIVVIGTAFEHSLDFFND
jgi:geranylgeranylglyceryl phosphate synthase family protein